MNAAQKSLLNSLYEQDKRNFISMSEQQINLAINGAFDAWIKAGGPDVILGEFSDALLSKAVEVTLDAAETLPGADVLLDKKTRPIIAGVLQRACQSGEFNTYLTVKSLTDSLMVAIRNRLIAKISAVLSEARAMAQVSPKLLAQAETTTKGDTEK